jgi:hypothetical protein
MGFRERDEHVKIDHLMNVDMLWGQAKAKNPKNSSKDSNARKERQPKPSDSKSETHIESATSINAATSSLFPMDTDDSVHELTEGLSAVSIRVPDAISFGHHRGRGRNRHSHNKGRGGGHT